MAHDGWSPERQPPFGSSHTTSAGRLPPDTGDVDISTAGTFSFTSGGSNIGGDMITRECHAASSLPAQHDAVRGRDVTGRTIRQQLSRLLSRNLIASGTFATGRAFDPRKSSTCSDMPQACMPRIKLRAMASSLALPLGDRQADNLKEVQVSAGQERDVDADGVPEVRLPWAIRPDIDFKIVNQKAWSAGVIAPVVRQVCVVWDVWWVLAAR